MSQHEHRMISVDSGSNEKLCECGYREGAAPGWKPEPSMTPKPPIPEDLQSRYEHALETVRILEHREGYEDSWDEAQQTIQDVLRIAKLTAANEELERENTRLKAPVTDDEIEDVSEDDWSTKRISSGGFRRILASRATRTPPQEGQ